MLHPFSFAAHHQSSHSKLLIESELLMCHTGNTAQCTCVVTVPCNTTVHTSWSQEALDVSLLSAYSMIANADTVSFQPHACAAGKKLPDMTACFAGVVQHFDWVSSAGAASCAQLLQSGSPSPHVPSKLDSQAFKEHPRLLFCKAWCLHEAAKLHLPLEARCLDLANLETHTTAASDAWTSTSPGDDQPAAGNHAGILHDLRSFMDDWCASFHEMLLEATAAGQLEAADRVKLLDAVDGRLWHFMTCCLLTSVPVGLPANARQTAQQLMQAVCQLAGIAANSITTDPHMQSHVSGGSQGQQPEAEGPDKPASSSLLVPRHTVHGNAFVDAFLAPQAATEGGDGMVAGDQQLALFDEAYHWHTGRPLEPTYLGELSQDFAPRLTGLCASLPANQWCYMFVLQPAQSTPLHIVISAVLAVCAKTAQFS